MNDLASYIDHTLLRQDATARDIETLCVEAGENGFFGVCIHGSWVPRACRLLSGTGVAVVSVAGFPLGAASTEAKCFETGSVLDKGAAEMDVVLNIGRLKQGDDAYVGRELREIVRTAGGKPVKVILETCLLSREEKIRACRMAVDSGAAFVKTSTGFSSGGATVDDVRLLSEYAGTGTAVKASGGIRDTATALAMIAAGARRLGTSSGVAIVKKQRREI
jgi:deoxyribose-phosphate aldolase